MRYFYLITLILTFSACELPTGAKNDSVRNPFTANEENEEEIPENPGKTSLFLPIRGEFGMYGKSKKGNFILYLNRKKLGKRQFHRHTSYWENVLAIGQNDRATIIQSDGEDTDEYGTNQPSTLMIDWKTNRWYLYVNAFEIDELIQKRQELGLDNVMMYNIEDIKSDYFGRNQLPPDWK